MSVHKEINALIQLAAALPGWSIKPVRNGQRTAVRTAGGSSFIIGANSTDQRAVQNARAELRRHARLEGLHV